MAGRKLRSGRFDADTTSFLIVVAVIAMELLFISALTGAETAYFALLPIVFAVSYLVVFVQITGDVAARQAGMRLKRSRYTDAMEFLRAGSIFAFAAGIVLSIFCSILGSFTAEKIIGSHEAALVLYALIPTLVFGGQLGNLKGFLECSGLTFVTRLGMYILAGSSVLFSILFGIRGSHYGDKVGALLRYDGYRGVYAAAGLVAGISTGVFITFLYYFVLSMMVGRRVLDREDYLGIDNEERLSELVRYYALKLLPESVPGLIPFLAFAADFKMSFSENAGKKMTLDAMSGFAGVTVPVLCIASLVCAMFFTGLVSLLQQDFLKEKKRSLRLRLSMTLRLSAYLSIPVCLFLFGSAKPIVQIFRRGLNNAAREGAVLSLKTGCMIPFLLSTAVLMVFFYYGCYYREIVTISACTSFVVQTIVMFLLVRFTGLGIMSFSLSLTVFAMTCLLTAFILGRRELLRLTDTSFFVDYGMILAASVVSSIPVILTNDFMTDEIIPVGGVILQLIIFIPLYWIISIMVRAADLKNIRRVPGGSYVLAIARLLRMW